MKKLSSRTGSAILVVLGMTAFLLVSAIAFSAYMRYARLPSSYLRRTSSTRLLVKAGLARAIDEVDAAIGNNPYPGIGNKYVSTGSRSLTGTDVPRNVWHDRVFIGKETQVDQNTALDESTVSPLCVEALAYIPPAFVNEVRYYSRRTPTAYWHTLAFDAGRYAYCALDVSDCFDINRLAAGGEGGARSSAASRRVSLAYLFENSGHTAAGYGKNWDDFVKEYTDRKYDEDLSGFTLEGSSKPFVSVADFNLALGAKGGIGQFTSPFYDYIDKNRASFYPSGENARLYNRFTFVTDSLMSATESQSDDDSENESDYDELYDLAGDGQPFESALLTKGKSSSATMQQIIMSGAKGKVRLLQHVPTLTLAALVDYLDDNSYPVSLAIPTAERAPMCVAMKPNLDNATFKIKEDKSEIFDNADCSHKFDTASVGKEATVYQKVTYRIDPPADFLKGLGGGVQTLFTYPFNHEDGIENESFDIDGRLAVFFTLDSDPMSLRSGNGNGELLHCGNKSDFPGDCKIDNGIIFIPLKESPPKMKTSGIETQEDAVQSVKLDSTEAMKLSSQLDNYPISQVVYSWTVNYDSETGQWTPLVRPDNATVESATCKMPPLKSNGEVNTDYSNDASFKTLVQSGGGEAASLNVAVWVRVQNKEQKTVDLVPASMKDDQTFNDLNNTTFPDWQQFCGKNWPVMRFGMGVTINYKQSDLSEAAGKDTQVTISPEAIACCDPRFNHAPENWHSESDISAETWLKENYSSERDGDIFMSVSDQGYMQSIYELAFLPRLTDLNTVGDQQRGNLAALTSVTTKDNTFPAKGEETQLANFWRCYRPFATADSKFPNADDFASLGFKSGGRGFKVNPYSWSTNVLMAAFANTPVDWRMASTNNQEETLEKMTGEEFNQNYAWNGFESTPTDHKIYYEDLEKIAGTFMGRVASGRGGSTPGTSTDWRDAFDGLDWYGTDGADMLAGVTLRGFSDSQGLWSADRRFLYGFWRDCFASKQQLFLIFVRAEPVMMGSGAAGQIPPQLGARAVALVWRDPTKAKDDSTPHQTRILFYRQFE